ncbi:unnamed protein product [Blepharisma stoltei]|uniref:DNA polymerase kappa n=1 Tax=Blepharisma stoltei TaxID=1481888 RepID=A0AAU9I7P4_9CILI|nr:unnamed protein product [Blepharisma stoltei]
MENNEDTTPNIRHMYNFTHEKAGMQGLDREQIDKIIYETSKNSEHYKHEQQKTEQILKKTHQMKIEIEKYKEMGHEFLARAEANVNHLVESIEKSRVMTETWLHIDMDMFYASVEIRDNPELADKPIAVGGLSMISTANYIARRFGVRSAMPGFIGQKLCPDLIFVKHNFGKYQTEGQKIREIFKDYDPEFESMGLDEAYLWITPILDARGINNDEGRQVIASEIRAKIYEKTQLTASAGIACNKMLAKIASDANKPNGQFYLPPDRDTIINYLQNQNIRKIPGIGKVQEKILNELGVKTCADILRLKLELSFVYNESLNFFIRAALGIGSVHHSDVYEDQKSISISRTFKATNDMSFIDSKLRDFCESISEELIEKDAECKTVSVFVKTYKFENTNKSETSKRFIHKIDDIYNIAARLLATIKPFEPIRLLGLRASNLEFSRSKRKSIDSYWKIQEFTAPEISPVSTSEKEEPKTDESKEEFKEIMKGIKLIRQQCPKCQEWFTMSEYRMEIHIGECSPENFSLKRKIPVQQTTKKKLKTNNGVTLDKFFSKT